jgi:hypothetical protein
LAQRFLEFAPLKHWYAGMSMEAFSLKAVGSFVFFGDWLYTGTQAFCTGASGR